MSIVAVNKMRIMYFIFVSYDMRSTSYLAADVVFI